ncbi:MAG: HAMP domain-containing protein [Alphaproteobacteria bacterium]|nr:MAG: HAMP domain-containing protein [Alphaproteobacteria bacterium]
MASALRSLKIQAGIAVAVAFCAGVAAAGALSYDAMSRTLDQAHRNALGAAAKDGLSTLAAVRNRMKVYSDVMSRHPEMVAAVDKRDPGQLEAVTVREFKAMHALDPSLASLEVTDSKGIILQRGHNPAKRGDDKSAQPQVRSALAGKAAGGLTVSPTSGEAAEDSVMPIRQGDSVIGTIKLGSYFNEATASELKQRTGLDIVFVTKGKIAASTFGKDVPVALPPQAIQSSIAGAPVVADLTLADMPYSAQMVTLASDVGDVVALVIILPVAFFLAHLATLQLLKLASAMRELAAGRFDVILPGIARNDEIGDIARAVENFKTVAVEKAAAEQQERREADLRRQAEQRQNTKKLADEFETAIGSIVGAVSTNAGLLESAAGMLTKTAEKTQQLSTMVASSSEEASANVRSVAGSTEKLISSVGMVAEQVRRSSKIANEAVAQVQKADARITDLTAAATRIGDVVQLISSVAEQTNLLALNATIEAARAGEAGRGFAVVAQEVKALASQTAKATEEIGAQVAGMQTSTSETVNAIREINATIGSVSEIASSIASAVETQAVMTREIASNVGQAATGTAEVAANIANVSQGSVETGSASTQVLQSARSLSNESAHLKAAVEKFLVTVRAA